MSEMNFSLWGHTQCSDILQWGDYTRTHTHTEIKAHDINLEQRRECWMMQLTGLCRCNYSIHSVDWFWIEYCARLDDLNVQMSRKISDHEWNTHTDRDGWIYSLVFMEVIVCAFRLAPANYNSNTSKKLLDFWLFWWNELKNVC